ncbi:hypothetical protein ISR94_01205 [Candidatus Microgenomates bacterium]|nr:hypothetical protein [Candidatus Microgenomates bacterium]
MKKIFILTILFLFFVFSPSVYAQDSNKFITIVNPVRVSRYTPDLTESIRNQYSVIKKHNLPATWLLTYDALDNEEVVQEILQMDEFQEFGLFLEVTPSFSDSVGVEYHDSGSWHHSNSIFLSGYTKVERMILIDGVFEKFKENFGYYPNSVGSWWTDGFSLSYIKQKYNVTANLVCADQFSTDNYQLWGQPWQIPYYPSKFHPAVPASSEDTKLDMVNIQWASRDPLNGYESSLFSTQDYLVLSNKLDTGYFNKLLDTYLNNENNDFNQITVGLESDLDAGGYSGEFQNQIEVVAEFINGGVEAITMSDFYKRYSDKYPKIDPPSKIDSRDFLQSGKSSHWFTSFIYRLFYIYDEKKDAIEIKDIRVYGQNDTDPYYSSPNYEFNLSINIPSVIDTIENPEDVWILPGDVEIETKNEYFLIKGENIKVPTKLRNNPLVDIEHSGDDVKIGFVQINFNHPEGDIVKGFSSEAVHFFKTKKAILKLLTGKGWEHFNKVEYLIPKGEIYALLFLKSLPGGKVMVYDNECLQCAWHTDIKPISFANLRSYVKKYSGHTIVYNSSVFSAKERPNAKKYLQKTKAKYVYLVKFEEYSEKIPFSPGDLGVKRIFSNANAEIWEVE